MKKKKKKEKKKTKDIPPIKIMNKFYKINR